MRTIDLCLKLLKRLHLVKASLPSQPLFDLFKIYRGVYCGAIAMHKNTDWEMHPDGDETLTLLSGLIDLVFEDADGEHTFVLKPGELLFMTFGDTTKHRPVSQV